MTVCRHIMFRFSRDCAISSYIVKVFALQEHQIHKVFSHVCRLPFPQFFGDHFKFSENLREIFFAKGFQDQFCQQNTQGVVRDVLKAKLVEGPHDYVKKFISRKKLLHKFDRLFHETSQVNCPNENQGTSCYSVKGSMNHESKMLA